METFGIICTVAFVGVICGLILARALDRVLKTR